MAGSLYFDDITSETQLWRHAAPHAALYRRQQNLPAASDWSTDELFASRVVVQRSRPRALDLGQPLTLSALQPEAELSKIIDPLPLDLRDLTETQLIHRLGGLAGLFWGALHRFTRRTSSSSTTSTDDGSDMMDLDVVDDSGLPSLPVSRLQRVRPPIQPPPGYVDSGTTTFGSSSPLVPSSSLGNISDASYVSAGGDDPEDETVQLASAFLRSALVYCPLQLAADMATIPYLVEFSGTRRCLSARLGGQQAQDLRLCATADGELRVLLNQGDGGFGRRGEVVTLLEAKKKFKVIRNGRPVITDKVLGQMVGEALTLRLSLTAQPLHDYGEDVVVIAAARQYMCFLSVHIPDEYVQQAQSPDNHLGGGDDEFSGRHDVAGGGVGKEPVITISATDWLNLAEQHGRKIACENITTLVHWRQEH